MMALRKPTSRKILYVGSFGMGETSAHRFDALRRLEQDAQPFDLQLYAPKNRITFWLRFRYPFGPLVSRINRDLVNAVQRIRPDVVWFDKPTLFTPATMRAIRRAGAHIVFYMIDGPFGPGNYPCWRQFMRTYRMADLHCLVRQADVIRYLAWGLPFVKIMLSFDPLIHFAPGPEFGDLQRDREISYIGHPYDQRAEFVLKIARNYHLPVFINGNRWQRALSPEDLQHLTLGKWLPNAQYREGIWHSKINLSFVSETSEEDIGHKAVEIAGCGGFLMAVRTPGHQAIFEEDREAVFFSSVEECADKCKFYLGRPDLREAIAARGHERAVRDGYDNDTQLARVLNRLDAKEV